MSTAVAKPDNKAKPPAKRGRPTDYSEKLGIRLCQKIAEGKSLKKVCKLKQFPAYSTVFAWLKEHPEFKELYTEATKIRADADHEDIRDTADSATPDNVQVKKLQIDTKKWSMARMQPNKYGDKTVHEGSGGQGFTLVIQSSQPVLKDITPTG